MRNFTSSAASAWCRIDCYERQFHIASFQMDQAVLCVEGTHTFSDKNRIAFSSLPMRADDPKVTKVRSCIGKVCFNTIYQLKKTKKTIRSFLAKRIDFFRDRLSKFHF